MARLPTYFDPATALSVPLPIAPAVTGISRSSIYRAASEGRIRLLKQGRTTLVCMRSVRDYLDSLPVLKPQRAA